jgi:hypothetical protein
LNVATTCKRTKVKITELWNIDDIEPEMKTRFKRNKTVGHMFITRRIDNHLKALCISIFERLKAQFFRFKVGIKS